MKQSEGYIIMIGTGEDLAKAKVLERNPLPQSLQDVIIHSPHIVNAALQVADDAGVTATLKTPITEHMATILVAQEANPAIRKIKTALVGRNPRTTIGKAAVRKKFRR